LGISALSTPQGVSVFLLDEHHEAYLAWWSFFSERKLCGSRLLIHIDEHADFGLPTLTMPPPRLGGDRRTVERFVYRQLSIGTFLIPAAANRFFSELVWFRPSRELSPSERSVKIYPSLTQPFISFSTNEQLPMSFSYRTGRLAQFDIPDTDWILDVCLDSFACNASLTPEPFVLEITSNQYREMNRLELNPWNMRYGSAATTFLRDGKHFFELDLVGWSSPEIFGRQASTERRFQRFSAFLARAPRAPLMVTVSRSIRSGYLPKKEASSIEQQVIALLSKNF